MHHPQTQWRYAYWHNGAVHHHMCPRVSALRTGRTAPSYASRHARRASQRELLNRARRSESRVARQRESGSPRTAHARTHARKYGTPKVFMGINAECGMRSMQHLCIRKKGVHRPTNVRVNLWLAPSRPDSRRPGRAQLPLGVNTPGSGRVETWFAQRDVHPYLHGVSTYYKACRDH